MPRIAREAWVETVARFPANPSSPHRLGSRADRTLDEARSCLATLLGCPPEEVIFTSGASESNNLMVFHLAQVVDGPVLVSSLEHPSVVVSSARSSHSLPQPDAPALRQLPSGPGCRHRTGARDEVQWELLDRGELHLVRLTPHTPSRQTRPRRSRRPPHHYDTICALSPKSPALPPRPISTAAHTIRVVPPRGQARW
ncbi:MAG: aminotransferase class V-fold PLP-dependent enzyme [Limisphaerales bacterium]